MSSAEALPDVPSRTAANQQQQPQQENPFQANGELRRKADYIISHSRISRTEVQIVDPDSPQPTMLPPGDDRVDALFSSAPSAEEPEALVERSKAASVHSNSPAPNGSVQEKVTVGHETVVEVEVRAAETKADDYPQKAEQVKLKSKKRCSIQ